MILFSSSVISYAVDDTQYLFNLVRRRRRAGSVEASGIQVEERLDGDVERPAAEAMEVAGPIEDQVNGAEGMVYMSSKSASDGSYTLTVTFEIDVDASLAQVDVQNRVALAEPYLPVEVRKRGISVKKRSPDMLMVVMFCSPP